MPDEILNDGLYFDRTVQDWHRATFPRNYWAIDLDLMGACSRCRAPLYLIEATTNPDKPTTILCRLAARSDVPAFLVFHNGTRVTAGLLVSPEKHSRPFTAEELVEAIHVIRRGHECQPRA